MLCKGSPGPWVSWMVDGIQVGDDPGHGETVLLLSNITSSDAGLYACQAENVWGTDKLNVRVEVRCKYGNSLYCLVIKIKHQSTIQ